MTKPIVAIALGDPAGIGPEIALKATLDKRVRAISRPVLVGDAGALRLHAKACGFAADIQIISDFRDLGSEEKVTVLDLRQFGPGELRLGEIAPQHGKAAVDAAARAIAGAMSGEVAAVVACPQTEIAIKQAGIAFDGYPSFVARCTGTPEEDAYLMLCFDDKRIVHTTLHVSLARALGLVTRERVERVLRETDTTLRKLGVPAPRIAVSGLNPHAGEHGMFGTEEQDIIAPALQSARQQGIAADGPFGADTMFHKTGYDAFVVMIHDQGHITAKLLAPNRAAGMTIGTPILFSSMAHGSALDLAGQNKADPEAVIEAVHRLVGANTGSRYA